MNPAEILRRHAQLESDRKPVEEAWDLLERFVYPLGGGKFFQMLSTEGEIDWRRRNIYDDTAILGADTLAASIHGSLTSPAAKWFDYSFRDAALNTDVEARAWLDACGNIVWNAIQQSNFNLEISEGYLDLTSFGNTTFSQEPIDDLVYKGCVFNSIPIRESYFEEDSDGQILNLYRHLQWTPSKIVSKWGIENVPERVKTLYEAGSTVKLSIIYCVYTSNENKEADTTKVLSIEQRPFQNKYILKEGAVQIGETGGYYERPLYFVRWRRTSGSQWGYGPGHIALSTILTLNELVKMVLESAEKVIDPVSLIQQRGLLSDLDLTAGGQMIVKDVDKSVKAYQSTARFDVSSLTVADLRDMIRRLFHVDQLELKESPAMSATEVMVRYELMNRLLGPTMGRLQNDLLDPIVTNTFKMLFRMQQLPPMPESVAKAGGVVNIEYIGPLSRAQKTDEVAAVERWLGTIGGFAEMLPSLRFVPDPIAIAKYLADRLNVPNSLMRKDGAVKADMKAEKDQQQAMIQGEQRLQESEAASLEQQAT